MKKTTLILVLFLLILALFTILYIEIRRGSQLAVAIVAIIGTATLMLLGAAISIIHGLIQERVEQARNDRLMKERQERVEQATPQVIVMQAPTTEGRRLSQQEVLQLPPVRVDKSDTEVY